MSLSGEVSRPDFTTHYDDSTTADVILVLGPDDAIYAHRMFLAVGSEHFEDQLRDPEYMRNDRRVTEYRVPRRGINVLSTVIKYIYGFEAEDCVDDMPETLYEVAEIGATAEYYGVPGLVEWASEIADSLLAACLSDNTKLGEFLDFKWFHSKGTSKNTLVYDQMVEFVRKHLKELSTKTAFRKLLESGPKLGRDILGQAED